MLTAVLFQDQATSLVIPKAGEIGEGEVFQSAAGDGCMAGVVFVQLSMLLMNLQQLLSQRRRNLPHESFARCMNGLDGDALQLIAEIVLGGWQQQFGEQLRVRFVIQQRFPERFHVTVRQRRAAILEALQQQALVEQLRCVPAAEAIAVARHEKHQFGIAVVILQLDRRREPAQQ